MTVGRLRELIQGISDDTLVRISYDGNRVLFGAPDTSATSVEEVAKMSEPESVFGKNWKVGKQR